MVSSQLSRKSFTRPHLGRCRAPNSGPAEGGSLRAPVYPARPFGHSQGAAVPLGTSRLPRWRGADLSRILQEAPACRPFAGAPSRTRPWLWGSPVLIRVPSRPSRPGRHRAVLGLSLIHISEPTRRTPISYAV